MAFRNVSFVLKINLRMECHYGHLSFAMFFPIIDWAVEAK